MILTLPVSFTAIVRSTICGMVAAGFACLISQPSAAALFTLVDGNSTANFQTASADNNFNWTVNGVDHLRQQAFWYRIGNTAEHSVHTLPIDVQGVTDATFDGNPDTLFVRYLGESFRIDTRYSLDGGTIGRSDLAEQISITNVGGAPLEFHFFQYANFDLQGEDGGDSVVFTNANAVQQSKGALRLIETIVTPVPSHREAAFNPQTLNKLIDGGPTTLSDTPIGTVVGPGNVTWAYQWDFLLQPGASYLISKDKNLVVIPEPCVGVLLSVLLPTLLAAYRQR